jgi:iron(III) transport system substrate-binding protein
MNRSIHAVLVVAFIVAIAHYATGAVRAADWQAGAGADWQKVMAAAKKEGSVAVIGPPQVASALTKAFQRDTGIDLKYLAGPPRATASRVSREVRARNITVDAVLTGMAELPLVKEGYFEAIRPKLMLPGVTDPKNWKDGKLKFDDDANKFMLQTHQYRSSVPFYNPKVVGSFTSWHQLLDPKFTGKIVAYDPRTGGPGQAVSTYIVNTLGLDFFKKLYVGQKVTFSLDANQMAEWVVRGVKYVALGVTTPSYLKFKNAGVDTIAPADPDDGSGTLTGGYSVIILPKGSPHPNAQTVFVNWYASQPGQVAFSRAFHVPSLREDVDVKGIPDYVIPKPGRKYQDQYNEAWASSGKPKIRKQVLTILGGK